MKLALSLIVASSLFIIACIGVIADHKYSQINHTDPKECSAALQNDGFAPRSFEENQAWKERVTKACGR